ncbi:pentatricopeptide repeat-containing protein at2g20540-like protein [Trifolium pratense]|uniref:Pentatricopeptide repeat-containing protein at2g20540-like protein n=1 Tax=Trifolium pratense TaxID=57577 RepID=A0A2K3MXL9_TRIPR|nr:pentatricopeptide repeat-containing protein at2g20540-like protein [Trifolium pratense]
MLQSELKPDNYTLPYLLKACASIHDCSFGKMIHGYGSKLGLVFDIFVGNSLMAMYCVFGDVVAARHVFDEIPWLSAVSWSVMISGYAKVGDVDSARLFFDEAPEKDKGIWGAMISGYVQNSCFKESLYLFRLMQLTDIVPDESIFVSILSACAHLGALDIGVWIHRCLNRSKLVPLSVRLSTSLLDMYAKCGNLELAKRLFDSMQERDIICWNAMISGMAMHGDGKGALKLFYEMEKVGMKPDDITFIAVFTACSYSGMAYEGLMLLDKMCSVYHIEPKSEHYSCLVDLLSRKGFFEEAMVVIRKMTNSWNGSEETLAWRAFLSACCNHGETQLAELAAEKVFRLDNHIHSGVYVLLSNLYAASGKHTDARRVRDMMKIKGANKSPGCSSVEIDGVVTQFNSTSCAMPSLLCEDEVEDSWPIFLHLITAGTWEEPVLRNWRNNMACTAQLIERPVDSSNSAGHNQPVAKRARPPTDWLKCNVDATFFEDIGTMSTNCCFRNSRGKFVMAQTRWRFSRTSVMEGEATALTNKIIMASSCL